MTADPSTDSYRKAVELLYSLRWFGAKFGLENTLKLAELSGNPQNKLRFIHVAGTNGKGSTCAMLESIYRAAGLRVGLFTSPHLVSFRERIQINRKWILQSDVVNLVAEIRPLLEKFPQEHHPTFFEVVTVMALRYFAGQKCDLVIWETGLGGRLDATNIVSPLASVITNVHFDHQQWLGDTLEKIAAEKAGIIKPGIPVVTTEDKSEALAVIERTAKVQKAHLTIVGRPTGRVRNPAPIALPGRHQEINAALAIETIRVLQQQIPVSEEQIHSGFSHLDWPGRLQVIDRQQGQKLLLDGAHNVASAAALRSALDENFSRSHIVLVLGILRDKDWREMCEILAPVAKHIFTVPVSSERTAAPAELAQACQRANPTAEIIVCSSLADALERAAREKFVVITGSLYLVGEALELLGMGEGGANERGLNEWSTASSASADKVR